MQKKGIIGLYVYVPRGWYKLQVRWYWVLRATAIVLRYYYWYLLVNYRLTYSYLLYRVRLVRKVGFRGTFGHTFGHNPKYLFISSV